MQSQAKARTEWVLWGCSKTCSILNTDQRVFCIFALSTNIPPMVLSKRIIANLKPARARGNVLAVTVSVIGVVVAFAFFVLGVQQMLLVASKQSNNAEAQSLTLAEMLNANDQSGRINNMIEHCREGVFYCRQTNNNSKDAHANLAPLTLTILNEARDNAKLLELERQALLTAETGSVNNAATPQVVKITSGYVDGVESNVSLPELDSDLTDHDSKKNFSNKDQGVYKGNVNATLPSPDDDLNFKLSSLYAPDGANAKSASLLAMPKFKSSSDGNLPSALKVDFKSTTPGVSSDMITSSAAAATGAGQEP